MSIRLEQLQVGAKIIGLIEGEAATILNATLRGVSTVELIYKGPSGSLGNELVTRADEDRLSIDQSNSRFGWDADGKLFRLVAEAHRIRLAYLFDPHLAVHLSRVEPLPHQISAVYGDLLPRQPLRFLLADDPGAGKTIQTGLYLKELAIRGDLKKCLIVCPGSLGEQWQDELFHRFDLEFDILSREGIENSRSGNPFAEKSFLIARLDMLSRDEALQEKLSATDWDVIVVDEAHKMSASHFGGEKKATKRYRLGELLGKICRNFLLLTATPHNGKDEDFQYFMALLDGDRFEGKYRSDVHKADISDLMRRRVKEELLRFDGKRLFPERRAYTVNYELSANEAHLYEQTTEYVREEMNRAERVSREGDKRGGAMVGFALTILQRRLASSPEAIYQSIGRRKRRLQARVAEEKQGTRVSLADMDELDDVDITGDDFEDETPNEELEKLEEAIVDKASAARTLAELETEIKALERLELLALAVKGSGTDRKWDELSRLLQGEGENATEFFDGSGARRKLIIFTEHRDTLTYLETRIRALLGREDAVVSIHGGVSREKRREVQEKFSNEKEVLVLLATDAAGEGINLQRAHLMVNYDLPWNPNRIEQRFGRIHRIGQSEVCHLWNLVAVETREGQVWKTLFDKLERQRQALGSRVFDVLGSCFDGNSLRQMMIKAIQDSTGSEARRYVEESLSHLLDTENLRKLLEEHSLARQTISLSEVERIRADMERAYARRLQPHFIASFFRAAFEQLGGELRAREAGRFEIPRVPIAVRDRDRHIGVGLPVAASYERVTFEKERVQIAGKPNAALLCPGHPLLDAVGDLMLEKHRETLQRGAILVDETEGCKPRTLWMLESTVVDGRPKADGQRTTISKKLQFIEFDESSHARDAGYAPYLDYRPATAAEVAALSGQADEGDEDRILEFAAGELAPQHLAEVRAGKKEELDRIESAVRDRLNKEAQYWDGRARQLSLQEAAGKRNAKINSTLARRRAEELEARLHKRLEQIAQQRNITLKPPVIVGAALIVPAASVKPTIDLTSTPGGEDVRPLIDALAVEAVMQSERALGNKPTEMPHHNPGYDIESLDAQTGKLRFLEVKGKLEGQTTVTVSKTQILTALNAPDDWFLVIVPVKTSPDGLKATEPRYLAAPFTKEPDFAATSINFDLGKLLEN